jgi:hypothetical protein
MIMELRMINFASARNMVIGSTMFEHRDIHKMTWRSPDGNTFNEIDHLLIDARHQSNLMDIKTHRGANVDSDHYLSVSRIRARNSNAGKILGEHATKFNCKKLKDPEVQSSYKDRLEEPLTELTDSESVSGRWKALKDIITDTADSILGKADKTKYEDWFDEECEQATATKNIAYRRM